VRRTNLEGLCRRHRYDYWTKLLTKARLGLLSQDADTRTRKFRRSKRRKNHID
jgi:hypothetical protein